MDAPTGFAPTRPEAPDTLSNPSLVLLATILATLCVICAVAAVSHQSAFSEYLAMARGCLEPSGCPSRGGKTGGLGLYHGAAWIDVLSTALRLGYDQVFVQYIVLGLLLVSLFVTFWFVKRYLGLCSATIALGLSLPLFLAGSEFSYLNYHNLLPLPLAIYFASSALLTESRSAVFAIPASISLAIAVSIELACIVMAPFHLLLVTLTMRRKVPSVAVAIAVLVMTFCLDSMDAAREIVRHILTAPFLTGLLISAGAVLVIARTSPRVLFLTSAPMADRIRTLMTLALIYATSTAWVGAVLLTHALPQPRYFMPAVFPILFLVAEQVGLADRRATLGLGVLVGVTLLSLSFSTHALMYFQLAFMVVITAFAIAAGLRTWRIGAAATPHRSRWAPILFCSSAIAVSIADIVVLHARGASQEFTLSEAERLVPQLYATGLTYPEVVGALQGPAADDLMSLLSERDPLWFGEPPGPLVRKDFSLLVIKVPNAAIQQARGVIARVPVDDRRSAIVVRGERSYLDWIHLRRCLWTSIRGQSVYNCVAPEPAQPVSHRYPYVEFGASSRLSDTHPEYSAADQRTRFEVAVHVPGNGVPHIVRTVNQWPATWHIIRVSGVEFEGHLPGPEIRLPDSHEAEGVVEFEYDLAGSRAELPWVWVPYVAEVREDDAQLLREIRSFVPDAT